MLTPRVRAAILNYSTIALVGNMQNFIQPLFMSTPTRYGGLGLSPSQIGSFLGALGIYNGIAQGLLFPPVHRKLGTTNLFRISLGSYILLFCFWPIISHLAKQTDEVSGTLIRLQIAQLSLLPLGRMAFSESYSLQFLFVSRTRSLPLVRLLKYIPHLRGPIPTLHGRYRRSRPDLCCSFAFCGTIPGRDFVRRVYREECFGRGSCLCHSDLYSSCVPGRNSHPSESCEESKRGIIA